MEKLSNNIANKVALELSLDHDNREVIAYGTFALMQMFVSIIFVFLFGLLFHVAFGALIISFTAAVLRKYSGGVHASSPGNCTCIGTIVCVGQAVLISFLISSVVNLKLIIILGVMTFIWAYYIIYKLAPVDSASKPIVKEEKRKRMKRGSIILLSVYLIIAVVFILLYLGSGESKLMLYALCLYSGILWQVFTLTTLGHLLVGKVDTFLNHIH
ncbi:accessory gene regulator B family protein [Clostridium tagluense]|uniref:accessory gene regulator ArgB-like protein n=1 Tax=Clostridium tagluense TaxID=360422 RepID=UPI001CF1147E|nr:accessory gene regulator B family protein [Clostridium tagluense]MCB2313445.1 accessory gene regulator B family protein [Clostridium tagluense]MCB2318288.1 accessory gene regulator B family protein [Clostridium tagluense]MCB2323089.1 accessory gene regulator B family protein [Clostridium tagluense]MCB2328072.1 accessory gene regulator B family protein [Clostridium tagluense]MCB2332772.1 accessory gene regulator B family protein [Clostridium tagluense]